MSTDRLEKSHASLFALPEEEVAIGALLLLAFILSLLEQFILSSFSVLSLLYLFTLSLILLFTFPLLTLLHEDEKSALAPHRSLWTSFLSVLMGGPLYLLGVSLRRSPLGTFFILMGIGLILFWDLLVTYSLSVTTFQKAAGTVLPGIFLYLLGNTFISPYNSVITEKMLVLALLTIMVFTMAILILKSFVNFATSLSVKVDGMSLFRGFALAWLDRKRKPLESVFKKMSVERSLPIHLYFFKAGEEYKGTWVIPTIHPGPLLNVGSSDMTQRLSSALREKLGAPTMIFHGTCTHSENLPDVEEQDKIIEAILEQLNNAELIENISHPIKVMNDDISVFSQLLDDRVILSLSRSPKPMDDITFEVGKLGRIIAEKEGMDAAIIDTHNSIGFERKEGKKIEIQTPIADKILEGIEKALKELKNLPRDRNVKEIEFGIGKASGGLTVREGLASEGIKVAVLGIGEEKYVYVLLDANNLESRLREKILGALKENFEVEEGEVFTSDTHVVNATGSEGGYPLLNRRVEDSLIKGVKEATEKAMGDMESARIYALKVMVNVRVQGEESTSALIDFGENSRKIFRMALLVSLLPATLSTLLISLVPLFF